MPEEWFVRVQEKEYGPVDLETLKEWKAEGRLLPGNPVRRRDEENWSTATAIPDLFDSTASELAPNDLFRRRSFAEILADAFRIYRKGFWQFFVLSLFVAIPLLGLQLGWSFVRMPENGVAPPSSRIGGAVAVVMLAILLVVWPIFVAGLQFAVKEMAEGREIRLDALLRRSVNYWPRVARLCAVVYGSFLFWTGLPLLLALSTATSPSIPSILIALLALSFQVYVFGRLFTNFLFGQKACTIGDLDGTEALRESRELARSRKSEPLVQRPLFRGAVIVSLWVLVLIVVSVAVELPFTLARFQGITTFEDAYAMMQKVMNTPVPDTMMILTNVLSSLVNAILRPLLGIAFIVLYFDAKAR